VLELEKEKEMENNMRNGCPIKSVIVTYVCPFCEKEVTTTQEDWDKHCTDLCVFADYPSFQNPGTKIDPRTFPAYGLGITICKTEPKEPRDAIEYLAYRTLHMECDCGGTSHVELDGRVYPSHD
jgi:hypothetical protein